MRKKRILKMPKVSDRAVEMNDVLSASELAEVPARVEGREMMKLCHLCLCASVLISLSAFAAPSKAKAEVTEKKLSFDTGKKDKHGKAVRREFPVMFSIADRARKHKAKKAVKK